MSNTYYHNKPDSVSKNIEFIVEGIKTKGTIEKYTRGGSKSPTLEICIVNGKRYTPYAFSKSNIQITLNGLFSSVYNTNLMEQLINMPNPFLDSIKKDDWVGVPFFIPAKGS